MAGTPDDKKSMLILREAFRLNLMPKFDEIKYQRITIDQIKQKILVWNKQYINIYILNNFLMVKLLFFYLESE